VLGVEVTGNADQALVLALELGGPVGGAVDQRREVGVGEGVAEDDVDIEVVEPVLDGDVATARGSATVAIAAIKRDLATAAGLPG